MPRFLAVFVKAFHNRIVAPQSCLRCSDLSLERCGLNWDTATKTKTHFRGFTHMSQILQSQHISSLGSMSEFFYTWIFKCLCFCFVFLNHQTGFHEVSLCMKNCSLQMNVSNLTYKQGAIFILLYMILFYIFIC